MRHLMRLIVLFEIVVFGWIVLDARSQQAAAAGPTLTPTARPTVTPTTNPNLLVNGSMEGQYHQQCSRVGGEPWVPVFPCDPKNFDPATTYLWATVQVPTGWVGWWQPPNDNQKDPNYFNTFPAYCDFEKKGTPWTCVPWHNPEFRDTAGGPQDYGPSRKVAGDNSQKYFTFYSIHEAGLYQVVGGVKPGQRLRFSVYMEAWSSPNNDPDHSMNQPSMGMKVGIDPYGGSNPWGPTIVWSPVQDSFDHWGLFQVEAVAQADHVTVFTYSRPVLPLQHNDVYADEASLIVAGFVKPTLTQTATITATRRSVRTVTPTSTRGTNTPRPTATPRSTAAPTNSPTPLPTHTPTVVPIPTITPSPTQPPVLLIGMAGVNQIWTAGGIILGALALGYVVVRLTGSGSDSLGG